MLPHVAGTERKLVDTKRMFARAVHNNNNHFILHNTENIIQQKNTLNLNKQKNYSK